MDPIKRICLWSGPRNVSTAVMYAFDQRADTRCVDEPLYGYYLDRSDAQHPGRETVLGAMNRDGEAVVRDVILGTSDHRVLFLKQMAHHLRGLDWAFLDQTVNVVLTRDPEEVLPSLTQQVPEATLADTGYDTQVQLMRHLQTRGASPVVLDARELLLDPESVLRELCDRIDLAFDANMLSWPAGPRSCDGVWASHWYHNVHRSTGFAPYRPKTDPFPEHLEPLLAECQPLYQTLYAVALRAPTTHS